MICVQIVAGTIIYETKTSNKMIDKVIIVSELCTYSAKLIVNIKMGFLFADIKMLYQSGPINAELLKYWDYAADKAALILIINDISRSDDQVIFADTK